MSSNDWSVKNVRLEGDYLVLDVEPSVFNRKKYEGPMRFRLQYRSFKTEDDKAKTWADVLQHVTANAAENERKQKELLKQMQDFEVQQYEERKAKESELRKQLGLPEKQP